MITPDDLARRFAPPMTTGQLAARQLAFCDGAYQLAEQALTTLPRGHHLDQAVAALESANHWVAAGLAAQYADEADEADGHQYADLGRALPPTPAAHGLGDLDLNVSLWRTGLRGALQLHPLARLVAYTLAEAADEHGFIADADQPEVDELSLATGLDDGSVLQAIEVLATHGWIGRHNTGDVLTRYQLRMPAPTPR